MWVAIALAGGLGAACRYAVDHVVTLRSTGSMPWGTVTVNLSGSLAAGMLAALASGQLLGATSGTVLIGGFLGAYTTFSTAMYECVRLIEDGDRLAGLANLLGQLVLAVLGALAAWTATSALIS